MPTWLQSCLELARLDLATNMPLICIKLALLSINFILGDPGADSGAEDENQNGREKIRRAKVRKKNTSAWGQTLYAAVPNGRRNTRCRLGRKVFCPIGSEYSFGRLELLRKEFVPRRSYFSFVLLLVEFFPARFDFRLRPHYLFLGLRGWINFSRHANFHWDCMFFFFFFTQSKLLQLASRRSTFPFLEAKKKRLTQHRF